MVTQVKDDEKQPEDFKKDHGDKDADYGIAITLIDTKCQQIAILFVEDEKLKDLIPIVATLKVKDQGAFLLWDEMMLVVIKEPETTLVLIRIEV
jgi:hypothetical protein